MGLTGNDFSQDSDVSCMGCMFQDIQNESRGFLSVVFCLTNVKLLPPALLLTNCLGACSKLSYWELCLSRDQ